MHSIDNEQYKAANDKIFPPVPTCLGVSKKQEYNFCNYEYLHILLLFFFLFCVSAYLNCKVSAKRAEYKIKNEISCFYFGGEAT